MAQRSDVDEGQRRAADQGITELYAAHWHSLVRLGWLLLHDQQQAEECVQEAFVSVHAHWSQLRDVEMALPYLRRSVVNACRSAQRHRVVELRFLGREQGSRSTPGATAGASAEDTVLERAEGEHLLRALDRLPRRQREVLVLRFYLDLSERQIADSLGVSPGAVKSHAHRGVLALRTEMDPLS